MPHLLPTPHISTSVTRRSFFALAAAAATNAALGPMAACSAQLPDCAAQTSHAKYAWADASARRSSATIERVLGATRCALDELKAHESDSYYLSTSFGNTGPGGAGGDINAWDCWYPNGRPKSNGQAYMNCAGFVVAVLEACGANCDIVGSYVGSAGYNRGNKSNLSRWVMYLNDHAELRQRFESKQALLASGVLQKGDLIIADPRDWSAPGADCHIMFFWGDSPSHDVAWHSSNHAEGVMAGTCPGNMISKISAKWADVYWLHVPLQNAVKLLLQKKSAALEVADGGEGAPYYSLANAKFSIFERCEGGACSGLIAQFTTDSQGKAQVELPPNSDVWVREDAPPLGFCSWSAPMRLHVGQSGSSETLLDEPQTVRVSIEKADAETGTKAQGHATLAGAVFELVDSKGNSHTANTETNEEEKAVATFPEVARGRLKVREVKPPRGYRLTPLEGADENGWVELDAAPNDTLRCAAIAVASNDRVVRGDIEGVKIYEQEGDGASLRPTLEGATFALWLQDDGTLAKKGYEVRAIGDAHGNAVVNSAGQALKGACMGTVASGKDGRFTSKDLLADWSPEHHRGQQRPECALPYGTYAVVEMSCPDPSLRLAEPICDIELHAQAQVVFLSVENRRIYSPVRVRKVDAASGKSVLSPGTVIELLRRNDAGEYRVVEFALHMPENASVSRFVIPESGIVQFPEKLAWGSYAIREVSTIAPYVVRTKPVEFDVGKNHDWDESDIIEIDLPNEQATGRIDGLKVDALSQAGVSGAVYEARAAHDIVAPDGTVQLREGELAGTAQSDENGAWRIDKLPLGPGVAEYLIVETKSPEGYVSETEEKRVVLTWENDRQHIVSSSVEIQEQPTRVLLSKTDAETGEPIEGVEFLLSATLPPSSKAPNETGRDENENGQPSDVAQPEQSDAENEGADASAEASMVPESATMVTDSEGLADASHLARGFVYALKETKPRFDLGYVSNAEAPSRYLACDGRWYDDMSEWEKMKERGEKGDEAWHVTLENGFTRMKFFKVDAELYNATKNANGDNGNPEHAATKSHLSGGYFRLEDEEGNVVAPDDEGLDPTAWPAQGTNAVEFSRLRVGHSYWIVEVSAPDGYSVEEQRTEVRVEDSAKPIVAILKNRRNEVIVKTSDVAPRIATTAAGLAFAGGIAAMAAYTKRRRENAERAVSREKEHAGVSRP